MVAKLLRGVVIAGVLMAAAAPATFASDAPTTKADCEKHSDMHWDNAHHKCVRK